MRHVAILIETSRAYGRGLIRGISRYNAERGQWSTYFQPQGLGDPPPPWLAKWRGNGIIARIEDRRLARAVAQSRRPVVNLRGTLSDVAFPFIGSDNQAIARMGGAAEEQLGRAIEAMTRRDMDNARKVIAADAAIDTMENQVDRMTAQIFSS